MIAVDTNLLLYAHRADSPCTKRRRSVSRKWQEVPWPCIRRPQRPEAIFRWYPVEPDQVGEHVLRVGTFDGRGGENIQSFVLTICRRVLIDATDHESLISALFGSQPPACGDADVNGDGVISAADIVAAN